MFFRASEFYGGHKYGIIKGFLCHQYGIYVEASRDAVEGFFVRGSLWNT